MNKSFLAKLAVVFFLLAVAFGLAGWGAWKYWHAIFISLSYGTTDFARLNAENQAMKTPLNLTMYAMPAGFFCAAAGCLAASGLTLILDIISDAVNACTRRFSRKAARGDHHA
ncbi:MULTISPECIES: hypothetical protein [Pantoea]|uniref:hypothetical protein n=1 Tax=Pantoea TaxID=53335 RepID=UPI001CC1F044|nr:MULTISPECIES: hypothetical protein [Pantoea]